MPFWHHKPFNFIHYCGSKEEWQKGVDWHKWQAVKARNENWPDCCWEPGGGIAFTGQRGFQHVSTGGLATSGQAPWHFPSCCRWKLAETLCATFFTSNPDSEINGVTIPLHYMDQEFDFRNVNADTLGETTQRSYLRCHRVEELGNEYRWQFLCVIPDTTTLVGEWVTLTEHPSCPALLAIFTIPEGYPGIYSGFNLGEVTVIITQNTGCYFNIWHQAGSGGIACSGGSLAMKMFDYEGDGGINYSASAAYEEEEEPEPCVEVYEGCCVPETLHMWLWGGEYDCECWRGSSSLLTYDPEENAWFTAENACHSETKTYRFQYIGSGYFELIQDGIYNVADHVQSCSPFVWAGTIGSIMSQDPNCSMLWACISAEGCTATRPDWANDDEEEDPYPCCPLQDVPLAVTISGGSCADGTYTAWWAGPDLSSGWWSIDEMLWCNDTTAYLTIYITCATQSTGRPVLYLQCGSQFVGYDIQPTSEDCSMKTWTYSGISLSSDGGSGCGPATITITVSQEN